MRGWSRCFPSRLSFLCPLLAELAFFLFFSIVHIFEREKWGFLSGDQRDESHGFDGVLSW